MQTFTNISTTTTTRKPPIRLNNWNEIYGITEDFDGFSSNNRKKLNKILHESNSNGRLGGELD